MKSYLNRFIPLNPLIWIFTGLFGTLLSAQEAVPAAAATDEDEDVIVLSPFEVKASQSDPYLASNAVSGTRFNTKLKELPMPITVLTSEFMSDIGTVDLTDALEYAGAMKNTSSLSESVDAPSYNGISVSLRGYVVDAVYRNGFRSSATDDVLFIDRVEIIKGPSSVFAATTGPGGSINVITKKPSSKPEGLVSVRYGSWERLRAELLWSAPLNKSKTLKYLVGAAMEDYKSSPYDFAKSRKYVVGGALDWSPAKSTTVSMDIQWMKVEATPALSSAIFLGPRSASTPNAPVVNRLTDMPFGFNRHGPDAYSNNTQWAGSLSITHSFNKNWFFKIAGFGRHIEVDQFLTDGSSVVKIYASGIRVAQSQPKKLDAKNYSFTGQANLFGQFEYWGIKQKINIGVDGSTNPNQRNRQYWKGGAVAEINIDKPVYPSYGDYHQSPFVFYQDLKVRTFDKGATVNNIFTMFKDRLTLLQGYRYAESYAKVYGQRRNTGLPAPHLETIDKAGDMPSANIWNFGASYAFTRQLSGFYSYAESYVPQGWAFDRSGSPFEPIRGKGHNYGVKMDFFDSRLAVQVQGFHIDRFNIQQPDPDYAGYNVASGNERSKGFETSVIGRVVGNWRVVASYAYTDAKITKDPTRPQNVGTRASNRPKNQISVWNNYNWSKGVLRGFNAGVGVTYVDERRGNPNLADLPGLRLPSYTRVDFVVGYSRKILNMPASITVGLSNAFDKRYYQNYDGYGAPRNTNVTMRLRF